MPEGPGWIHEIKYDGYRTQLHLNAGKVGIFTRRGHDWIKRYPGIAADLQKLPVRDVIIDGEAVVRDAEGVPDFKALQAAFNAGHGRSIVFYAFDILYMDGYDLRKAPLIDRKRILKALLPGNLPHILYSDHFESGDQQLLQRACDMRLEGIVSKRRDAPYRSGDTDAWIKAKCGTRDSFPIVGFVEKLGARPRRIASFYIGRHADGKLLYGGKVQSGFTLEEAEAIRERLDPYIADASPLDVPVNKPKATWVRPVISTEVSFTTTTSEGLLREPVFKGLREDISPRLPAAPTPRKRAAPPPPSGKTGSVPRENILQLLPDAVAPTPAQLKTYWRRVGKQALTHLGNRPLKLVRRVGDVVFYHKGPLPALGAGVNLMKIEKREGGEGSRVWIDSIEGFLGLVDMDVVELHPWNATVDDPEHADRLVFDLDPGDGVAWALVTETALALKELLAAEGYDSWPKVTGGKGLHVMAPLADTMTHDTARAYCRSLCAQLMRRSPDKYVIVADPKQRGGRIFLDYLRNGRGTTAAGAYSPRARQGFPVAMPVTWRDVASGIAPDSFRLQKVSGSRRR